MSGILKRLWKLRWIYRILSVSGNERGASVEIKTRKDFWWKEEVQTACDAGECPGPWILQEIHLLNISLAVWLCTHIWGSESMFTYMLVPWGGGGVHLERKEEKEGPWSWNKCSFKLCHSPQWVVYHKLDRFRDGRPERLNLSKIQMTRRESWDGNWSPWFPMNCIIFEEDGEQCRRLAELLLGQVAVWSSPFLAYAVCTQRCP